MTRLGCLTLIFYALSFPVIGQKALTPGYITIQGDTSYGNVQFIETNNKHVSCVFEKDGRQTTYSASEITTIGIDKRVFVPAVIDSTKQFAELIEDGPAQLLHTEGIYHIRKGEELISVKPMERTVYVDNTAYAFEDRSFRGHLTVLLSDCKQQEFLARKIDRIRPTRSRYKEPCLEVVQAYNACVRGETLLIKKQQVQSFGLYAGINRPFAEIHAQQPSSNPFTDHEFSPTWQLSAGIFLDVMPRPNKNYRLQFGVAYSKTEFEGNRTDPPASGSYNSFRMSYSSVVIPISIRHDILQATAVTSYLRLGFAGQFTFGGVKSVEYWLGKVISEWDYLEAAKFSIPVFGGLGVEKEIKGNFLFLEGRYTAGPRTLRKYDYVSFDVSSIDILLGMRF